MPGKAKQIAKRFTASLERLRGNLGWVVAYLPFDARKVWGKGRVKVRGEINGFPFRTSLFATRDGRYFLLVNKAMQKGAQVRLGDKAEIRLENDLEERTATVPPELERELKQSKALRKWFDELSHSIRYYLVSLVQKPKSAEAKKRQAAKMAELLYSAMDAERDLPPALRAAFARRPKAHEGWERMSPTHRRHHLLGIFYHRGLEARERRIEKMLDECEARVKE